MSTYTEKANKFLKRNNTTCEIRPVGQARNGCWGEKELRNLYDVVLSNEKGSVNIQFWGSVYDAEINRMTADDCAKKKYGCTMEGLTPSLRASVWRELKAMKDKTFPTPYDILSVVTKYDPGTFSNFCSEFGYSNDSIRALKIYHATQEEYDSLCRIFTPKQMEEMAEIQ